MGCIIGENTNPQKLELKNDINNKNLHNNTLSTAKENSIPYTNSFENLNLNNSNNAFRNSLFSLNNHSNNKINNTFHINNLKCINNNNDNNENNNNNINDNNNNDNFENNKNNVNNDNKENNDISDNNNNSKDNIINKVTLILKLSNDFEKNYETIIIKENILTSKQSETKIIKENKTPIKFSFGSGIINDNDVSSSSFSSSKSEIKDEVDFAIYELNIQPHQFDIEFNDGKYYMNDCYRENGMFLKINEKIKIESEIKYTFLIYNNCIVDFFIKNSSQSVIIDIKNIKKKKFNYKKKNIVTIGKSNNNDFILPFEEGISRVQLTFFYNDIEEEFYVYDGFFEKEKNIVKPSTNGIWLSIFSKIEIENDMIFRIGKTFIFCKLKGNK